MTRIQKVIADFNQKISHLQAELFETEKRLRNAERILEEYGMRRCNIPTCNCSSYHSETSEPEV